MMSPSGAARTPLGSRPGTANASLPTLPPQKVNAERRMQVKKKHRNGNARERPRPRRPQEPIPWNRSTACPSYDSTLVVQDQDLWCNPRFRAPMPRRRLQSKKTAVRPKSAPAARRTDGRRVRDDPIYHKTGVLYAQYDGGALQRPRVVQQASVASTATPADSVAKWPTRWRQKGGRNLPLPPFTTPFAGKALQGMLDAKAAKHKRDQINSKSQRVRKPF